MFFFATSAVSILASRIRRTSFRFPSDRKLFVQKRSAAAEKNESERRELQIQPAIGRRERSSKESSSLIGRNRLAAAISHQKQIVVGVTLVCTHTYVHTLARSDGGPRPRCAPTAAGPRQRPRERCLRVAVAQHDADQSRFVCFARYRRSVLFFSLFCALGRRAGNAPRRNDRVVNKRLCAFASL